MPRAAVPPDKRRRVARACDSCKRRKERCNGLSPCSICVRRHVEPQCTFSDTPARLLRINGPGSAEPQSSDSGATSLTPIIGSVMSRPVPGGPNLPSDVFESSQADMAIDRLLNGPSVQEGQKRRPSPSIPERAGNSNGLEAPVPRVARLLRDGQGKYMFIGDSATLSFLQSVRRIVASSIGDVDFVTDQNRHSILERTPAHSEMQHPDHSVMDLNPHHVETLARQYLVVTNGLLDLFDLDTFFQDLAAWSADPRRDYDIKSAAFYLVMAIGAQALGASNVTQRPSHTRASAQAFGEEPPALYPTANHNLAERYFARGRHLAFFTFTDAPSMLAVQSFSLIAVYMLGACRRNGAYMNFAIAIRAAFALGIHRANTHRLFDEREARARKAIWRSLRMIDVFLTASLGRPPATKDLSLADDGDSVATDEIAAKVLELCTIFDRIILEVYMKRAVSTGLAESISQELKSWTTRLPTALQLGTPTSLSAASDYEAMSRNLSATQIISCYHWAIVLLTRPFLTSQILQDMSRRQARKNPAVIDDEEVTAIKTFADACVNSSLKGIAIAEDLLVYKDMLPRRLPIILDNVVNFALVVGAAAFADQDRHFPLEEGLEQAMKFLQHFAPYDPHSTRYGQIIAYLHQAVKTYLRRRNRLSMEHRSKEVTRLFGSVGSSSYDTKAPTTMPLTTTSGENTPKMPPILLTPGASEVSSTSPHALNTDPATYMGGQSNAAEVMNYETRFPSVDQSIQPTANMLSDPVLGNGFFDYGNTFPDDAYFFMDQEPSMFGTWVD